MTDFIQIDEKTFWEERPKCTTDKQLEDKIRTMFEKCSCFNEYGAFQSYKMRKSHSFPSRKKLYNETQTGSDREITALLNKISKRNYITILKYFIKIVTLNNVEGIVRHILDKCQKQTCFLDLYVNLLNDIYARGNLELKQVMHKALSEYVDEFLKNKEFKNFTLSSQDYDEFCTNLSNRSQIIGKHKTILALIRKVFRNNLIDEYFNIMFNEIIQIDKIEADISEEMETQELLLEIIGDFVKTDMKYKVVVEKYYHTHTSILDQYSLKARFKVMDIVKLTRT